MLCTRVCEYPKLTVNLPFHLNKLFKQKRKLRYSSHIHAWRIVKFQRNYTKTSARAKDPRHIPAGIMTWGDLDINTAELEDAIADRSNERLVYRTDLRELCWNTNTHVLSQLNNNTRALLCRREHRHKRRSTTVASQAPRAQFLLSLLAGGVVLKVLLTRMESQFTIRRKNSKGMWFW